MSAWRKVLILVVALTATVAAVASGSESDGGGSSKSSGDTATTADSASSGTPAGDAGEVDDVKINSCGKDADLGWAKANITVTNNSSKASDYLIEITFTSKDGKTQIGTGNTIISNLAPGQMKTEDVSALEDAGDAEIVCTVTDASRTASL